MPSIGESSAGQTAEHEDRDPAPMTVAAVGCIALVRLISSCKVVCKAAMHADGNHT